MKYPKWFVFSLGPEEEAAIAKGVQKASEIGAKRVIVKDARNLHIDDVPSHTATVLFEKSAVENVFAVSEDEALWATIFYGCEAKLQKYMQGLGRKFQVRKADGKPFDASTSQDTEMILHLPDPDSEITCVSFDFDGYYAQLRA